MKKFLTLLLLLLTTYCMAQLPDAPQPVKKQGPDWKLAGALAAWAGADITDAAVSQIAFRKGCVEGNPTYIGHNQRPGIGKLLERDAIFEGPVIVGFVLLRHYVRKRRYTDQDAVFVIPVIPVALHLMATGTGCYGTH